MANKRSVDFPVSRLVFESILCEHLGGRLCISSLQVTMGVCVEILENKVLFRHMACIIVCREMIGIAFGVGSGSDGLN